MMLFTSTTAPVAGLNILYSTLKVTLEFNSILGVQKLPFDDGQIIVNLLHDELEINGRQNAFRLRQYQPSLYWKWIQ
jgi:hypothetical protein